MVEQPDLEGDTEFPIRIQKAHNHGVAVVSVAVGEEPTQSEIPREKNTYQSHGKIVREGAV